LLGAVVAGGICCAAKGACGDADIEPSGCARLPLPGTGFGTARSCVGVKGVRHMARKYSKSASKDVERAMHKKKRGTLKSGSKTVKSRKQAIAIGLSEARKKGKKVPKKKAS
jgi:hypothetical protein